MRLVAKKLVRTTTMITGWLVWLIVVTACSAPGTPVSPTTTAPVQPRLTATPTRPPRPPAERTATTAPITHRTIQLNEPVEAIYIPGQVRELYAFYSNRARRIGVELVALDGDGDLRLQAQVYDPAGILITKASAPVGQPLLRDVWDLPEPGTYTLQVFGPETQSRAFGLTVMSQPMPETGGGPIAYGESRSGEIRMHGQRDQWVFEGRTGDQVSLTLIAPGHDGYLELYDPDGDLFAQSDDDTRFGYDPALTVSLPGNGEYVIVVRMYGDEQVGAYQLRLERIGPTLED